jgi:hypothetical protein
MQATRRLVCLAFALLAVPIGARAAEDETERFQALEERMRVLEDKLAASSATIEAQQEMLARATPDVAADGAAFDSFLSKLEVGGFVTGSYLYNFNQPGHPSTGAASQPINQFNNRHDEFSFDAAKIEIGKTPGGPGEAGFQFEMLYGQNADILRRGSPTRITDVDGDGTADVISVGAFGDSDMGVFVQEAYASYNLGGVTWKLGKFETLLGYEVLDSYKNPNITHGVLFTWAIPLYHTGLLASGNFSEAVTWSLGLTDGFNNVIENNDGKAIVGQLAFTSGPFFAALNGFFGSEASEGSDSAVTQGSVDDFWIFDGILTFAPSDSMSFWVNADLGTVEDLPLVDSATLAVPVGDDDPEYWGVAVGGKFKITDKLGFALRGEYFEDDDNIRGTAFGLIGVDGADIEILTATGTLSYAFTQNLLLRGEVRWDQADNSVSSALGGGDGEIFPEGNHVDDSSVLGLVEVSYIFD